MVKICFECNQLIIDEQNEIAKNLLNGYKSVSEFSGYESSSSESRTGKN